MRRRAFLSLLAQAATARANNFTGKLVWNVDLLFVKPRFYKVPSDEPGVEALFYEGEIYRGKPTRVFAYYGFPRRLAGRKCPGIVLVHGGDGTAFAEWVRLWNSRGYAAIAMDTNGSEPEAARGQPYLVAAERHTDAGPVGWGGFDQIDEPITDQWSYHAVAAVVRAHSLLRSFETVDSDAVGITGISWGGYLSLITASIDRRFRFTAPVYGCGFLQQDSMWLDDFKKMGVTRADRWTKLWDPRWYIPAITAPTLWLDGTNDIPFPLPSLQKSYRLMRAPRTLSTHVRMPHGHPDGAAPLEIPAFANGVLGLGRPLASVGTLQIGANAMARASFRSADPVARAELNFTTDSVDWKNRTWKAAPATLHAGEITAAVPSTATAFFFNLIDQRGLIVSSEARIRR